MPRPLLYIALLLAILGVVALLVPNFGQTTALYFFGGAILLDIISALTGK